MRLYEQSKFQTSEVALLRLGARKIGRGSEEVALPDNVETVADLVAWLKTRGPEFGEAFARPEIVRTALDKSHVKSDAPVLGAREIAFFPPVTGG